MRAVSILVLLEKLLEEQLTIAMKALTESFNPCSSGKATGRTKHTRRVLEVTRFNPCSSGKATGSCYYRIKVIGSYSVSILVLLEKLLEAMDPRKWIGQA